ncbi:MAG: tRNA (N(6)-L-threonylcarbamoyladenosine(37)-C(2))-methylthiotransferase MtaB [Agathobacter sp.]|nr:tRNA (N(6)-L-threonylcarbamoyladenosine(37)-C(2))-methylthiotransferase MtaB [Agathobacter sp.]
MKKAALHNLGCKVNAYETEAMQQMLETAGYEIVSFGEEADVYVINTCSVTNMADRKSRQMLHRAKKQNPEAVVVAAGCYVQTKEQEAVVDEAIDIIIGNNKKHELISRLDEFFRDHGKIDAVLDINDKNQEYEELFMDRPSEHTRAFIKVQDGCNQFCSYCIIPYARGRVRSRSLESVLEEVKRLAENGYQEVVLTGIHLSSYLSSKIEEDGTTKEVSLLQLIQAIHTIEGIKHIRLGSLEPKVVTDEFARELSKLEKICPHFHLSLQSGCDATLQRMNRKYTAEEYENGCNTLRKYFAHPAITTDVIVGFPGETEEEFAITKAFLEKIHFYEMHIFQYSKRQGTRAAVMKDQVPENIKKERSAELIALGDKMSKEFREYYLGKEEEVLFEEEIHFSEQMQATSATIEEISGKYYVGYTREYVKVVKYSEEPLENRIVRGTLTKMLSDEIYLME